MAGWYGNGDEYNDDHPLIKRSIYCCKLRITCLNIARKNLVSVCNGISGGMGTLIVDEHFVDENVDFPIDDCVGDLTIDDDFGYGLGAVCNI